MLFLDDQVSLQMLNFPERRQELIQRGLSADDEYNAPSWVFLHKASKTTSKQPYPESEPDLNREPDPQRAKLDNASPKPADDTTNRPELETQNKKYVGVTFQRRTSRWKASIYMKSQPIHLGTFRTPLEAALVVDRGRIIAGQSAMNFDEKESANIDSPSFDKIRAVVQASSAKHVQKRREKGDPIGQASSVEDESSMSDENRDKVQDDDEDHDDHPGDEQPPNGDKDPDATQAFLQNSVMAVSGEKHGSKKRPKGDKYCGFFGVAREYQTDGPVLYSSSTSIGDGTRWKLGKYENGRAAAYAHDIACTFLHRTKKINFVRFSRSP